MRRLLISLGSIRRSSLVQHQSPQSDSSPFIMTRRLGLFWREWHRDVDTVMLPMAYRFALFGLLSDGPWTGSRALTHEEMDARDLYGHARIHII